MYDQITGGAILLGNVVASIVKSAAHGAVWETDPNTVIVDPGITQLKVKVGLIRVGLTDPTVINYYTLALVNDKGGYPIDVVEVIQYDQGIYLRIDNVEIIIFSYPDYVILNLESVQRLCRLAIKGNDEIMEFLQSIKGGKDERSQSSK